MLLVSAARFGSVTSGSGSFAECQSLETFSPGLHPSQHCQVYGNNAIGLHGMNKLYNWNRMAHGDRKAMNEMTFKRILSLRGRKMLDSPHFEWSINSRICDFVQCRDCNYPQIT